MSTRRRCLLLVVFNVFFIHNRSDWFGLMCCKFCLEVFHYVDTKKWCQRSSVGGIDCDFKVLRLDTDALHIFRRSEKLENRGGTRGLVGLHSPHPTNMCNSQYFILVSRLQCYYDVCRLYLCGPWLGHVTKLFISVESFFRYQYSPLVSNGIICCELSLPAGYILQENKEIVGWSVQQTALVYPVTPLVKVTRYGNYMTFWISIHLGSKSNTNTTRLSHN